MRKIKMLKSFGSNSVSPAQREESENYKMQAQGDEPSLYSRQSNGCAMSQKITHETRDQRIFDIYMKAPYRLMDASKQRR